ncbi:MAG TPA: tetratricopeptide repeat protein [Chthoniobacterales bacterium]
MAGEESQTTLTGEKTASRFCTYLQRDWCRVLFLLLIAFVIHAPSLSGELIWDDNYLAHDNPLIKSPLFIFEVFRHHLFLDSLSAHYRPVQNLSFIFDYFLWNDDTFGFHLTNITLHAVSGVLLYFLLRRLFASLFATQLGSSVRSTAAFLVALLWTVHPVHSAAIDYISGRADSLAFLFAVGGWLLFLRAGETVSRRLRWVLSASAAGAVLLALCSRETALLWLLIFLLHTLAFSSNMGRRRKTVTLVTCLSLVAIYGFLHQLPEHRPESGAAPGWPAPVRAVLMLRALGDYGRLMVFPMNLHMERTVVDMSNYGNRMSWQESAGTEYLSIFGLLVCALLVAGCCRGGIGRRARIFGAAWFVVGFLPISNLFDLNATVAEHWLYLPSVGLLIFAAGVALDFPASSRRVLASGACLAAVALSLRSAERSGDWITPEHFYLQTLAAGGTSSRVSLNLGQLYAERGEFARAEATFRKVLAADPDYPIAQNNLGNALFHQGKKKEAELFFAAAAKAAPHERKDYPRTWIAALNLAGLHKEQKDASGALAIIDKARADYPRVWEVVSFESELLRSTRGPDAAIPLVENFRRDNWWSYPASFALGQLYAEKGDVAKAEEALRRASLLDVHEVEALNRIAQLRMRQNRLAEACATQRRAVARQPDRPREYLFLSKILEKMGRTAEAEEAVATVARLKNSARNFTPGVAN